MRISLNKIFAATNPHALALTEQPWHREVVSHLGTPGKAASALLGVDIGHVKLPGRILSEACAGFFADWGKLDVAVTLFPPQVGSSFRRIETMLWGNKTPSSTVHRAFNAASPQVNTLIFNGFTLVYASPGQPTATYQLLMHNEAKCEDLDILRETIERSLKLFTDVHECLGDTTLVVPTAQELRRMSA